MEVLYDTIDPSGVSTINFWRNLYQILGPLILG